MADAEADDPADAEGGVDEGGVDGFADDGGFDGRLGSLGDDGDEDRFMSLAARIVNVLAFVSTRTSCPVATCLAAVEGDDGGCVAGGCADGVEGGCCDDDGCCEDGGC
jgi:hypothetical protein